MMYINQYQTRIRYVRIKHVRIFSILEGLVHMYICTRYVARRYLYDYMYKVYQNQINTRNISIKYMYTRYISRPYAHMYIYEVL